MQVIVNGSKHDVDVSPDMPLLWVLREVLGLTGTKFGCGMAQCGACTSWNGWEFVFRNDRHKPMPAKEWRFPSLAGVVFTADSRE